jgi:hypothetical protein
MGLIVIAMGVEIDWAVEQVLGEVVEDIAEPLAAH